ncbi:MAG: agmatinase [Pseudomonadota bacterium]
MTQMLTQAPQEPGYTFLNFPLALNVEDLKADIAILGVPFGLPYDSKGAPNDQSLAPDRLRCNSDQSPYSRERFDWDLDGPLLNNQAITVVDCGNVTADPSDPQVHYRRATTVANMIFERGATVVTLGGDHGVTIPVLRATKCLNRPITLVHVDAHLDWRDESKGVREGFRSPIRRASEMAWIDQIVQIGIRGIGSLVTDEVKEARRHGGKIITAYEMHRRGMDWVLSQIGDGGPFYLTIDADGLDPAIMPGVMSPTPGGLDWMQIHQLIHGLSRKGSIVGMDLVEIAPRHDVGNLTLVHAERLICNFIGACARNGQLRPRHH